MKNEKLGHPCKSFRRSCLNYCRDEGERPQSLGADPSHPTLEAKGARAPEFPPGPFWKKVQENGHNWCENSKKRCDFK